MSVQHGTMARVTPSQVTLPQATPPLSALAHRADEHNREAQASLGEGVGRRILGGGAGIGGGALARAVERWRRALLHDQAQPAPGFAGSPTPGQSAAASSAIPPADTEGLTALARRLDDSGCSYGRVSAARLDAVTRAYDRLETKMNAVLMAVTGTFLSTLAGLLLYYVRGGGQ